MYLWKDMMFRNGYLFQKFKINKLVHENVCPMLDEVRRFQLDSNLLEENGGAYDSDQDEWDMMKDDTILKTIRNDVQLQI